jgi:hypothetical protein
MHKNFNTAASVIVEMTKELSEQKSALDGPLLKHLIIPKLRAKGKQTTSSESDDASEEPAS